MTHKQEITLLGGRKAQVFWNDGSDEAEVAMPVAFASYIHKHTVQDAKQKAWRLLPNNITNIIITTY